MAMRLADIGHVKSIAFDEQWHEVEPDVQLNLGQQRREFEHKHNSKARIIYYYRGRPVTVGCGEDFLTILKSEPHLLSRQEFESIEVIIADASEPDWFEMISLKTAFVGNKKVLIAEGVWKLSSLYDYGIFHDADGTGAVVEEWHYVSPEKDRNTYLQDALKVLDSIIW
jgi:hypothetical protein